VHASGVLAVVVAGLLLGHRAPVLQTASSRIAERLNWRTISFLLENTVFLLIGLQARWILRDVQASDVPTSTVVTLCIATFLAVVLLRLIWVFPARYLLVRRSVDPETGRHPSWRYTLVLGWAGMRGVVTLAAAQSLPADIPYRPQLILIAFTVAFVSLVVQGGTLPWLIRALGLQGIDIKDDRRLLAQLLDNLSEAGLAVLDDPEAVAGTTAPVDPEVVERVRQTTYLRAEAAWERIVLYDTPPEGRPHHVYRTLRLAVVDAERDRLLAERARGAYPSRILSEAQNMLDIEETRLQSRAR